MLVLLIMLYSGCNYSEDALSPTGHQLGEKPPKVYTGDLGDLVAGQNTKIGTVAASISGNTLTLTYNVTEAGYFLTSTHVYVGVVPPPTSAPGQFQFSHGSLAYVTNDSYTIDLSTVAGWPSPDGCLWIAAHGVAEGLGTGGIQAVCNFLPETATVSADFNLNQSYLTISITNAGSMNGVYNGWCIDAGTAAQLNTPFVANVYCSYEPLPPGTVIYPENLDLVNWILNQDFVGKTSPLYGTAYTFADVQIAIYNLLDNQVTYSHMNGNFDLNRVAEIKAAAFANGEGFEPVCGDVLAVILKPIENIQPMIIPIPLTCGTNTVWAYGVPGSESPIKFDHGWGWYWKLCP